MCGITGIIRWGDALPRQSEIEKMTKALAHRGPDGEGTYVCDFAAIGHRRLSIIDLDGGGQPMANEDGTIRITFNGEIYNFKDLRAELSLAGHRFATRSDTEVIVHAYEQWGEGCVAKLRGMFAFAVLDARKRRIFLGRDHFGIKPLVYRAGRNYFAFASEINTLLLVDDEKPRGDISAIEEFLRFQYIPAPRTVFKNIYKLEPAHWMSVRFDGSTTGPVRYWEPGFSESPDMPENAWLERARAAIDESVRAHLVSDVPFGVFLSGGIDSTLIANAMRNILGDQIKAFSIGFDDPAVSELDHAEHAARTMGISVISEIVSRGSLDGLADLVNRYGEPFGDSSILPTWQVSRLARQHVPMVLSGDGGDEMFGGYDTYLGWMNNHPFNRASSFFSSGNLKTALICFVNALRYRVLKRQRYHPSEWLEFAYYFGTPARRALWRPGYHSLLHQTCGPYSEAARRGQNLDRMSFAQNMDFQTYLPGDILNKVDIASMCHGLEVRTPLIDLRVFELAASLPVQYRYAEHSNRPEGKILLKKLLEPGFGASFAWRSKQGFAVPRDAWFNEKSPARSMLMDELLRSDSLLRQWFNISYIQYLFDTHGKGRDNGGLLWLLLVLALWIRNNNDVLF